MRPGRYEAAADSVQDRAEISAASAPLDGFPDDLAELARVYVLPGIRARRPLEAMEATAAKQCEALVAQLPIAAWWTVNVQKSLLTLAGIIGDAGDLSRFSTPEKLTKYLSLAPYNGHLGSTWKVAQWRPETPGKADWIAMGHAGDTRSMLYQWSDATIKNRLPYRRFYDAAKARMIARNESGGDEEKAAGLVERYRKEGKASIAANVAGKLTDGHIDRMARVKMEQRLIDDLWAAWRGASLEGYS